MRFILFKHWLHFYVTSSGYDTLYVFWQTKTPKNPPLFMCLLSNQFLYNLWDTYYQTQAIAMWKNETDHVLVMPEIWETCQIHFIYQ